MTFASGTRVARNPECFGTGVDGNFVLLSMELGQYLSLNPTAEAVWALIETPRTVDDLCAALKARFDVDADRCQAETVALLTRFRELRLIVDQS